MEKGQLLHVSMINSYNLITNKITVSQAEDAGIPIFAHNPEADIIKFRELELIIEYFSVIEMFEECEILMKYRDRYYHKNGEDKNVPHCRCKLPKIETYTMPMYCSACDKKLKYE